MCDSVWPYGLWPTRLICAWDSPSKNTGVGCHALVQGIFHTQGSNLSLMSPALAGEFFITSDTWEAQDSSLENIQWWPQPIHAIPYLSLFITLCCNLLSACLSLLLVCKFSKQWKGCGWRCYCFWSRNLKKCDLFFYHSFFSFLFQFLC